MDSSVAVIGYEVSYFVSVKTAVLMRAVELDTVIVTGKLVRNGPLLNVAFLLTACYNVVTF